MFLPTNRWHHRPRRGGGRSRGRSRSRNSGCIVGEVKVLTPTGYRAISSLKAGDWVVSLDKGRVAVLRRVRRVLVCGARPVYTVVTEDSLFKATQGHLFLTARGWVRTRFLRPSDTLVSLRGTRQKVISVTLSPSVEPVYNLRTEGEHNFIIETKIVAHNYCFLPRLRMIFDELLHSLTGWNLQLTTTWARDNSQTQDKPLGS
jgi:hypothetical protein